MLHALRAPQNAAPSIPKKDSDTAGSKQLHTRLQSQKLCADRLQHQTESLHGELKLVPYSTVLCCTPKAYVKLRENNLALPYVRSYTL